LPSTSASLSALLERVATTLGVAKPADTKPDTEKPAPKGRAVPGVGTDQDIAQLSAGMEVMRSDLRRNGAAVSGAVTAILTAIGYTQLHQIFPIPPDSAAWFGPAAIGGMALAVIGSALLVGRVFAAQRRILLGTDAEGTGLSHHERTRARSMLTEHAREERATTLRALEYRMLRLERVARRRSALAVPQPHHTTSVPPDPAQVEADRINGFILIALKRVAASILEERTRKALGGWVSALAFFLAAAGVTTTFALADYSSGQRSLVALREKCVPMETTVANACSAVDSKKTILDRAADRAKPKPTAVENALACVRTVESTAGLTTGAHHELVDACATLVTAAVPAPAATPKTGG